MSTKSSPAVQFWRDRGTLEWARVLPTYWEATAQPHRTALIEALRKFPRFESARELGCCAGTNIKMLRDVMPWVTVEGLELSPDASIFAQKKFQDDHAVRIGCTDILAEQDCWEPREVDVVFTCYTLAYVNPDDMPRLMASVIRSAAVGVVIVEPMYGDVGRIPVHFTTEWRHDYARVLDTVFHESGRKGTMTVEKLVTPTEYCDGVARIMFND